jgi:hypothetical protein
MAKCSQPFVIFRLLQENAMFVSRLIYFLVFGVLSYFQALSHSLVSLYNKSPLITCRLEVICTYTKAHEPLTNLEGFIPASLCPIPYLIPLCIVRTCFRFLRSVAINIYSSRPLVFRKPRCSAIEIK